MACFTIWTNDGTWRIDYVCETLALANRHKKELVKDIGMGSTDICIKEFSSEAVAFHAESLIFNGMRFSPACIQAEESALEPVAVAAELTQWDKQIIAGMRDTIARIETAIAGHDDSAKVRPAIGDSSPMPVAYWRQKIALNLGWISDIEKGLNK